MSKPKSGDELELLIAELKGRIFYLEDMVGRIIATLPKSEQVSDYEPDFIDNLAHEAADLEASQMHHDADVLRAIAKGARESAHAVGGSIGDMDREL